MNTLTMAIILFALIGTASCKKNIQHEDPKQSIPLLKTQAAGLVQTQWPSSEDPGFPFYARIEPTPPHFYHNGEYAAIVFYRPPSSIPPSFNLLTMFNPPAVFAAPSSVQGTNLWNGMPGTGAPRIVTSSATGDVHIWFVPYNALQNVMNHLPGFLTITQLSAIPGILHGHAEQFNEVNHPHPLPPQMGGGGHPVPKLALSATGKIDEGGSFHLTISGHQKAGEWVRKMTASFMN